MDELLYGLGNLLVYFISAVIVVLGVRRFVRYDELFRKLLHFVLLGSLAVWTVSFPTWWIEALSVIGFVIVVYPILMFFERFQTYSKMVTERKKGELKTSLVLVFVMFALVITVTEGIFADRYLALASLYAWGIGDALAALVGKRFGKHKLTGRFLTGQKSLEGTLAMFCAAFVSVLALLLLRGGLPAAVLVLIAVVTAAVAAACELYTRDGLDTVTCPLAAMTVMLLLLFAFGGL